MQRHEAEISIQPVPIFKLDTRFPFPVQIDKIVAEWETNIASYLDPPISGRDRDIVESLLALKPIPSILYLLSVIVIVLMLTIHFRLIKKPTTAAWDVLSIGLSQSYQDSNYRHFLAKLSILTFIIGALFVNILYNSMFGTDLTVEYHQPPIDRLTDLLESDKNPAFETKSSLYNEYKKAPSDNLYGQVWKRINANRDIYDEQGMVRLAMFMRRSDRNLAMIGPRVSLDIVRHISCAIDPRLAKSFHISHHNIRTWLHGVASATNARPEVVRLVSRISGRAMERGFQTHMDRHSGYDMAMSFYGDDVRFQITRCINGLDGSVENEAVILLKLRDMNMLLFRVGLGLLVIAAAILVSEILRNVTHRRKRLVLKRRRPQIDKNGFRLAITKI